AAVTRRLRPGRPAGCTGLLGRGWRWRRPLPNAPSLPDGCQPCHDSQGLGGCPGDTICTEEVKSSMAQGQKRNRALVPQAQSALERLKQEVATELGIPNYQGYL